VKSAPSAFPLAFHPFPLHRAKEQNSFPEKFPAVPSQSRRRFLIAQASLRASAFVSALVALAVLVTSDETIVLFGIKFRAHYSYASAFR